MSKTFHLAKITGNIETSGSDSNKFETNKTIYHINEIIRLGIKLKTSLT